MLKALLGAILMIAPLAAATAQAHGTHADQKAHKEIKIETLKSYIDEKKPMVLLDARSKKYMDGNLIPTAKWVAYDASDKEIAAAAPSKDSLIVVYCAGPGCPASGYLYDKLTSLGYTNVLEYHGGINEWITKGYPTVKK